ncbi:MAG TPA: glycosyltransferase, partial [Kofleriaceae bacterium]
MRLSLCMIARDEEEDLPRLLESVRDLADELVLVDTGSRDATVRYARDAGARIVELAWPNDFAAARNVSLDHASGDWILVLDADEEVVDVAALRTELEEAHRMELAGLSLLQRNLSPPGEATTYTDLPIVRAFRRG